MPLVLIWCAQPWLVVAGVPHSRWFQPATGPVFLWLGLAGATACVLATAATFSCWREMGKSWRLGIDPEEKTQLVSTGPYRFARHPIYALSSVLVLGTLAAISSPVMAGIALLHLALLQVEARREEKYLLAKHGGAYAEYMKRVGRFLPRNVF
jgi:protein-S-isoprenylcysteine O-methyltransferase Ste14